jgi:hypothetical protein
MVLNWAELDTTPALLLVKVKSTCTEELTVLAGINLTTWEELDTVPDGSVNDPVIMTLPNADPDIR